VENKMKKDEARGRYYPRPFYIRVRLLYNNGVN